MRMMRFKIATFANRTAFDIRSEREWAEDTARAVGRIVYGPRRGRYLVTRIVKENGWYDYFDAFSNDPLRKVYVRTVEAKYVRPVPA